MPETRPIILCSMTLKQNQIIAIITEKARWLFNCYVEKFKFSLWSDRSHSHCIVIICPFVKKCQIFIVKLLD